MIFEFKVQCSRSETSRNVEPGTLNLELSIGADYNLFAGDGSHLMPASSSEKIRVAQRKI